MSVLAALVAVTAVIPVAYAGAITGDFSQMVYKPTRLAVYRVLRTRSRIIGVSVALWVIALILHATVEATSTVLIIVTGVLIALFTVLGFVMSPYVMFPSIRDPEWLGAGDDRVTLTDDDPVIGLEVNGDARAFPVDWSFRPHLVEATVGGEPVVMSYCLLSNLGLAFTPELDGVAMRCIMPIQWENNMVIWDAAGKRLIQQIEGTVLHGPGAGSRLDVHPTQIMSWGSWRALHPDTRVFYNPPAGGWDTFVRKFIGTKFLEANRAREAPMFPTIERFDDRLPNKTEVIGIEHTAGARAHAVSRVCQEGVINDSVGDVPITLACTAGGAVAVFERARSGGVVELSRTETGELVDRRSGERWDGSGKALDGSGSDLVPFLHHSRVLWFVWANFHPDTELVA